MEPYRIFGRQSLEALSPGQRQEFVDCVIERKGDWYELGFTDAQGCRPVWPYAPKTRYLPKKNCWHVRQGWIELLVRESPVMELLFELRGYLLAGQPPRQAACLDIGPGASGLFGLYCAASGVQKVLFVEADPRALERVRANIALNKFTRAECLHAAVCGENGLVGLRQDADMDASSIVRVSDADLQVRAIRLKKLVAGLELDSATPLLCKLDIEGAEVELLEDLPELVRVYPKGVFAIASYHPVAGEESAHLLERELRDTGLGLKTLFGAHKTTFVYNPANAAVRGVLGKYESKSVPPAA